MKKIPIGKIIKTINEEIVLAAIRHDPLRLEKEICDALGIDIPFTKEDIEATLAKEDKDE